MARILRLVAAGLGAVAYVWFDAVRGIPGARRRKHARRRERRRRIASR